MADALLAALALAERAVVQLRADTRPALVQRLLATLAGVVLRWLGQPDYALDPGLLVLSDLAAMRRRISRARSSTSPQRAIHKSRPSDAMVGARSSPV
jgi:hypothetical protein